MYQVINGVETFSATEEMLIMVDADSFLL